MSATGLSADPKEYRARIDALSDDAIDAFAAELMRDLSIRIGVIKVLTEFMKSTGLNERELERCFAAGGGSPATLGRTADGHLMLPAISLHFLIPGVRRETADGRKRLVDYLVDSFHEIVFL